jgi:FkbM family methyltransferase
MIWCLLELNNEERIVGLRTIAERLSRGVVLRRRLPPEFGGARFYVSPGAGGLRYWRRNMRRVDPHLLSIISEYITPGMRVWYIGANIGLFTFCAAYRAGANGSILAVEPDIDNLSLILRTRRRLDPAGYAAVTAIPIAVAAPGQSFAEFQIATRSRSANALVGFGLSQSGGFIERRTVPLFSADELGEKFGWPEFVKIDVEGAEAQVLAGAERLLRDQRPVMLIEVDPDPLHMQKVAQSLAPFGYRFFDADVPTRDRTPVALPPWNALCIPKERLSPGSDLPGRSQSYSASVSPET